ncbi:MAG: hypothetical protein H8E20_06230 [Verrucomicrobia bacterium]|nr:hypothetical protein [Verrucomicrobiota bacterium]
MRFTKSITLFLFCTILSFTSTVMAWSADEREPRNKNRNKGRNNWDQSEYSGKRKEKDVRMAMYSKGFAWLSGSPTDNEKLSVGKTAQFFGFVALRYASGRVAQRGELGRAFYELATPSQREIMLEAAKEEASVLEAWWNCRSKILRKLEHHLYTGEEIKKGDIEPLAREFGWLNAKAGLIEARGIAAVEDTLTEAQWNQLHKLRQNPGLAAKGGKNHKRIRLPGLSRELAAQYEDLYAKAFTWLTGTMTDNQTIPLGQPAQFFGFVSIRHKSGHGASRGRISRQFSDILGDEQQARIIEASKQLWPEVKRFMLKRTELLLEMDKLRKTPDKFDAAKYKAVATELGVIEIQCGMIEATTYHQIRKGMTDSQSKKMMAIRSEYILDRKTMENLSITKRGQAIYTLCQTCHSNPQIAPTLNMIINRPIASLGDYEYSMAMKERGKKTVRWTEDLLDQFIAAPTKSIPGTKMGFQGLLNETDRTAIIHYLKTLEGK